MKNNGWGKILFLRTFLTSTCEKVEGIEVKREIVKLGWDVVLTKKVSVLLT